MVAYKAAVEAAYFDANDAIAREALKRRRTPMTEPKTIEELKAEMEAARDAYYDAAAAKATAVVAAYAAERRLTAPPTTPTTRLAPPTTKPLKSQDKTDD